MNLVISSLSRKFDQIDSRLRTRLSLDGLEIRGRRVLQKTNLEYEYQNAVLERVQRSAVQPVQLAPVIVNEPEPEHLIERGPVDHQIQEVDVSAVVPRRQAFYIPNGLDDAMTHVDFWRLEQGEGEGNEPAWSDPRPLAESIPDWQGNVQQAPPSEVHPTPPRLHTPRRRVLW